MKRNTYFTALLLGGIFVIALPACKRQSMPGQPVSPAENAPSAATIPADSGPVSETKVFAGTIGESNDLQMKLVHTGTDLSGTYSYLKIGKPITLKGTIDKEGNVELAEFDASGAQTGVFKGRWDASDQSAVRIEGNWSKPNGAKPTKFSLSEQPISFSGGLELIAKRGRNRTTS